MDQVVELLREIRDEAKQTNMRLESLERRVDITNTRLESLEGGVDITNTRLESLEGRVDVTNTSLGSLEGRVGFLEKRLTISLSEVGSRLDAHMERINALARTQADSELRLASEVLSLADVTREVRDLLSRRFDDHEQVQEHERRIRSIEDRIADK
jgi:chromosome segregation ATPase